jgi:hypothetical protein
MVTVIVYIPFYLSGAGYKLDYYHEYMMSGSNIVPNIYLLKSISLWAYVVAQIVIFYKYLFKNKERQNHKRSLDSWFGLFLVIQAIGSVGFVFIQQDRQYTIHIITDSISPPKKNCNEEQVSIAALRGRFSVYNSVC